MRENNYFHHTNDEEAYKFHQPGYYNSYEFLGSHPILSENNDLVRFVVWAPRAKEVYLMGDFNSWDRTSLPMKRMGDSGLWCIYVYDVKEFHAYKYVIVSQDDEILIKADPYGFHAEERPGTASKYYDIKGFHWEDDHWMKSRKENLRWDKPMAIYEVNLLSWRKKYDGKQYSYRDLAHELVLYVKDMGFNYIEIMPIMEHPYDGSWGYQQTGYFAPTSRYGTPKDFMYLVDQCHKNGIGVILDWVPIHFCRDDHGLRKFDGSYCFESINKILADNPGWGTLNFDYSKPEVVNFLISSAIYWHEYYHIDGLRVDAIAYILERNQEGIEFIKNLNMAINGKLPYSLIMAEDSSNFPKVTSPVDESGLGFKYKWNMGWMNDILNYMGTDPLFRKGNQKALTFGITYSFSENYLLPLSHDEVVHGKKSLLNKMPGSYEEKFANLRLLFLYMYCYPGKKLIFMGGEFGQFIEWDEWKELDWHLLDYEKHRKLQDFVKDLNYLYREEPCLYQQDNTYDGFNWIEHTNHQESIIAFERIDKEGNKIIGAFNFTPVERQNYPIGVDALNVYETIINSHDHKYGGDLKEIRSYKSKEEPVSNRKYSIRVDLPPLGGIIFKERG